VSEIPTPASSSLAQGPGEGHGQPGQQGQANQPLPVGTQLEQYRISGVLSWGGFSIVYLAVDKQGQTVAIKEFLPAQLALRTAGAALPRVAGMDEAAFRYGMKCFFEECRAIAGLSHPNVVRVLNFFRANDTAYLVMRYEAGCTLQQHIAGQEKGIPESVLRPLFVRLMNGLREVHAHRLLHLDIKPANIYIRNDGVPVLLDFGAARQTLDRTGLMLRPMHTPGFAPPEQHSRENLGPWTDIYSVGATLFTCMTGVAPRPPHQRLRGYGLSTSMGQLRGRYSADLLEVVDWCLELDPRLRPQSVFSLQKALVRDRGARAGVQRLMNRVQGRILRLAVL